MKILTKSKAEVNSHIDTLIELKKKFRQRVKYTIYGTADIIVQQETSSTKAEVYLDIFALQGANVGKLRKELESAVENVIELSKNGKIIYTSKVGKIDISEYTLKEFLKKYK